MWRRVRPVLLMTVRDLRRRPLRTILVAVLLALVTALASAAAGMAVASRSMSATSSVDPWVSATTLLVCVMALGIICLVTAPVHLAAAHRSMRQIGLPEAVGGRDGEVTLALVAPAGLTAVLGAAVGAPVGMLLATTALQASGDAGALTTVALNLGVVAIALVVVAINVVAALLTAWRLRGAAVVDTLHARLPEPAATRAPLRIGAAISCLVLGGGSVVLGLSRTDLLLIGIGAVVTWAGLATVLAVGLTSALGGVRGGPYSWRFALREGARHPMRVVPTTIASATMVALLVAAMAYVGSTHQAERDRYVPSGPPGSGLLLPSDENGTADVTPDGVEAMASLVAATGPEGRAIPLLTPDRQLLLSRDQQTVPLAPADVHSLMGGSTSPTALLASDELVDAWDYAPDVRDALAAGSLVVAPGTLTGGSGPAVLGGPGGAHEVVVAEILPVGPATALLPPAVGAELGTEVHAVAVLVVGLDTPALESLGQTAQDHGWWLAIEQGPPALEHAPTQYALLGAAAVVVALMLWIMGALAREEARSDVVTLEAVGARPAFMRWVAAWQAGGAAVIAVLAGVPVGLLSTRLLMTVRDSTIYAGAASDLVVPWVPVLAMLVVVPLVAGLGVAALQPRRPPLVRRLAE